MLNVRDWRYVGLARGNEGVKGVDNQDKQDQDRDVTEASRAPLFRDA